MFKLTREQIRILKEFAEGNTQDQGFLNWHQEQIESSNDFRKILTDRNFSVKAELTLDELYEIAGLLIVGLGSTVLAIKGSHSPFEANDIKIFNARLRDLLYSPGDLARRVDSFLDLEYVGLQTVSQFLCKFDYENYPFFAEFMRTIFDNILIGETQLTDAREQAEQEFSLGSEIRYSGTYRYFQYWVILRNIKDELKLRDYLETQNLLWRFYQSPEQEPEERNETTVSGERESQTLMGVERVAGGHLLAGKNVVFYGPPGTGKTFLAKRMAKIFCGRNVMLRTGNAEWTTFDVVGGLGLSGGKKTSAETPLFMLDFRKGFLTSAVQKATKELPCWLIIDEINRANLDLSFGKAFTLLDIDHRGEDEDALVDKDEYPNVPDAIKIPKSFRVIATMNSYDRAILFSLGFAFRRRFAFIELPSPFKHSATEYGLDSENEQNWRSRVNSVVKNDTYSNFQNWVENWINNFSKEEKILFWPFPHFEANLKTVYENIKSGAMDPYDPQAIIYSLADEITNKGLVEFGYAQIVDGLKYIIAFLALEENASARSANLIAEAVDNAFLAYFAPQFEYILPDLRREKISSEDGPELEKTLQQVIEILEKLGLKKSIVKLQLLKKEQKVF